MPHFRSGSMESDSGLRCIVHHGHGFYAAVDTFANCAEDSSTGVMPIPRFMFRVVVLTQMLNTPTPIVLGEDTRESLQLVVDHESGYVHSNR